MNTEPLPQPSMPDSTTEHELTPVQPQSIQQSAPADLLHGELYDRQLDSVLQRISHYMLQQPALVLTLGYLFCSLLGLIFVVRLFHHFDFAVLPYLEISDFLLAALTHPLTLLQLVLWTGGIVLLFWLDRMVRRAWRWYGLFSERFYAKPNYQKYNIIFVLLPPLFFLQAAFTAADELALQLKAGQTPCYQISLIYPWQDNAKTLKFEQAQVIARTVSYLFIYHQQQIKVIPNANIAVLLPQPQPVSQQPKMSAVLTKQQMVAEQKK